MGLGPTVLALYQQLKILDVFDGVTDVVELGSQGVWCPDRRLLDNLFEAFGKPTPPDDELKDYLNSTGTGIAQSRHLHEHLGFRYECIDIDEKFGSLALDLNFDNVPENWKGRFGLTTNHGTTEHLLNQQNAFKVVHDLTRVGGLMLHAVPFTHVGHGFFNYQPALFEGLARYNSYEMLGLWIGVDWRFSSFIPWEPQLMNFLKIDADSTHLLVALMRKKYATEFQVPIQNVYENMIPEHSAERYNFVVDGEYYSGRRVLYVTKADIGIPNTTPLPADHAPTPELPTGPTITRAPLTEYPGRELVRHLTYRIARRIGLRS